MRVEHLNKLKESTAEPVTTIYKNLKLAHDTMIFIDLSSLCHGSLAMAPC